MDKCSAGNDGARRSNQPVESDPGGASTPEGHQGQMMEDSVADHQPPQNRVEGDDVMEADPELEEVGKNGPLTREELEEEIKVLKAMLEEERGSNGRMAEAEKLLKEENQDLKKSLERAKQMFGKEWGQREQQWKRMEEELLQLEKEEEQLDKMASILKKTLSLASKEVGRKLEEIRSLTMSVDDLNSGKVKIKKQVEEVTVNELMGRKDAVAVFPEEVWIMILGNVPNPKDLWNLCNTCQLFDTILSKWKTGWMLKQALPYLYQHLPGNKLLESRLVCKSWKRTVDHFLEDHPSLRPHDPEKHEPRRLDFVNPMKEKEFGVSYELVIDSEINMSIFDDPAFMEKWKQIRVNGRRITMCFDYESEPADENSKKRCLEIWEKFYGFLYCFGKEVWYLNVQCLLSPTDDDDINDTWKQKLLNFLTKDIFGIFPELRRLRVSHPGWEMNPESLPPMTKLETFECDGMTTAVLTRFHTQFRCLNITAENWKNVNHLNWPNLTELHLNGFVRELDFANLFDGLRLRRSLPKLAKLGMNLEQLPDNGVEFQVLLEIISDLTDTTRLNTLRLEGGLRGLHIGEASMGSCYALSKIKTLEFHHFNGGFLTPPTYDFLLHFFPLLENLNVFVRNYEVDFFDDEHFCDTDIGLEPRNECQKLKRWGKQPEILELNKFMYDGEMYKSNIWELMPLLKVFSFQWDVYTRHEYEAYKEKLKSFN